MDDAHPAADRAAESHTAHDYVVLDTTSREADVQYGVRYWASVNNVENYGVFVSLNDPKDWDAEVNGLIHGTLIPRDLNPKDFAEGDEVGVMLESRSDDGLAFEMVAALDTLRNHQFEEPRPRQAPGDELAPAFNAADEGRREAPDEEADVEEAEAGDEFADDEAAPDEAAPDELELRLRAIEEALTRDRLDTEDALSDLAERVEAVGDSVDAALEEAAHGGAEGDWPGQYGLVAGLLRDAADDGKRVTNVEYDAAGDSATLTVEVAK